MPQIAQQDWVEERASSTGRLITNDAFSLGKMIEHYQRGNILSVLFLAKFKTSPDFIGKLHCIGFSKESTIGEIEFVFWDVKVRASKSFKDCYFTLSKIQLAQDEIKGSVLNELPTLAKSSNILTTSNSGAVAIIASEDGYVYNVSARMGVPPPAKFISSIEKSTVTVEEAKTALSISNVITLSEEDAANLVGYSITDND